MERARAAAPRFARRTTAAATRPGVAVRDVQPIVVGDRRVDVGRDEADLVAHGDRFALTESIVNAFSWKKLVPP